MSIKVFLTISFVSLLGVFYAMGASPDLDARVFTLPGRLADLWRVAVIAQAGLALGFLGQIIYYFFRAKKDAKDVLLWPTVFLCLVYFGMMLYIGIDLASRVDFSIRHPEYQQYVTWRTPTAFLLFLVSDAALYRLMVRVSKMLVARSQEPGSSVKLTLTEQKKGESTSVDLSSGDVVTPK